MTKLRQKFSSQFSQYTLLNHHHLRHTPSHHISHLWQCSLKMKQRVDCLWTLISTAIVYKNSLASGNPLSQTRGVASQNSIKIRGVAMMGVVYCPFLRRKFQTGTRALSVVRSTEVGRFSEVVNTLVLW